MNKEYEKLLLTENKLRDIESIIFRESQPIGHDFELKVQKAIYQAQLDKVLNQPWLDKPDSKGWWDKMIFESNKWHYDGRYFINSIADFPVYNNVKWQKAIMPDVPESSKER